MGIIISYRRKRCDTVLQIGINVSVELDASIFKKSLFWRQKNQVPSKRLYPPANLTVRQSQTKQRQIFQDA